MTEELLWKADIREEDEDETEGKPKPKGRLDTNPFNIPRVPGQDDPNTPGADELNDGAEAAAGSDDEDSDGSDETGDEDMPKNPAEQDDEELQGADEGEDNPEEGDAEDNPGEDSDGDGEADAEDDDDGIDSDGDGSDEDNAGDDEDLDSLGSLDGEDNADDSGDDDGMVELEAALASDDENPDGDNLQPGEVGSGEVRGSGDVQALVAQLADAEKHFYANKGMHGADHHETAKALDQFHRIVRALARAVGQGAPSDGQEQPEDAMGMEDMPEDQGDDQNAPDEAQGDSSEAETSPGKKTPFPPKDKKPASTKWHDSATLGDDELDTKAKDAGKVDEQGKPKKKGKIPPQFAKAIADRIIRRTAPTLMKAAIRREDKARVMSAVLRKAGGPFIGPRGGKWADAAHTIPYVEPSHRGDAGERERDGDREDPKPAKSDHSSRTRTPEGHYEYRYQHPDYAGDHEISFTVEKAPTKMRPDGYIVRVGTGHTLFHGGVSNGKVTDLDAWSAPGTKAASPAVQAVAKRALLDAHKMFTAEKAVGAPAKKPKAEATPIGERRASQAAYRKVTEAMNAPWEKRGDIDALSVKTWEGAILHMKKRGNIGKMRELGERFMHVMGDRARAGKLSEKDKAHAREVLKFAYNYQQAKEDQVKDSDLPKELLAGKMSGEPKMLIPYAKMKGGKKHPFSEAQRRWAFAAEERGELPKGKALEWAKRDKARKALIERGLLKAGPYIGPPGTEEETEAQRQKRLESTGQTRLALSNAIHSLTKSERARLFGKMRARLLN